MLANKVRELWNEASRRLLSGEGSLLGEVTMKALAVALLTSAAALSVSSAKATETGSRYTIPEAQPVRLICTEGGRCFRIIRGHEISRERLREEMGPRFREGREEMGPRVREELGRRIEQRTSEPHAGEPHTGITTGQGHTIGQGHMAPGQGHMAPQ